MKSKASKPAIPSPRYAVADSRKIDNSVTVYDTVTGFITHDIPAGSMSGVARVKVCKQIAAQLNRDFAETGNLFRTAYGTR